jgi:hypothetical protein
MNAEQHYRDAASHTLAGFQLIEESLKSYIGYYHEMIRRLLPTEVAYRHSRAEIQDAALGKLVNIFGKINSNEVLISQLRTHIKVRNELAHTAFLHLYGELPPQQELKSRTASFIQISENLGELLGNLNEESNVIVKANLKLRKV